MFQKISVAKQVVRLRRSFDVYNLEEGFGMVRYLASLGLLFCLVSSVLAQSDRPPAVAVLRDSEPAFDGTDIYHDHAILLDSEANVIKTISGLGLYQSWSHQNMLLFDMAHRHLILIENQRDRLSVFDYNGTSQLTIPIENANAITLTDDATMIGCMVSKTLNEQQTVYFETTTGKEIRRLNWGGVALINDVVGSQFWAVGKQLIAFEPEGEISVRRPLTRLPAEPHHPTVINSRNWCGVGVAVEPNANHWNRRIWVIEREHPDVKGSLNRLFAVDPDGQSRILVELNDIDPRSIACATYKGDLTLILVVDGATGDLVSFNSDGERMRKVELGVQMVGFGEHSGLWVAGRKSLQRLDPSDLSVVAQHTFEQDADPVGLAVH